MSLPAIHILWHPVSMKADLVGKGGILSSKLRLSLLLSEAPMSFLHVTVGKIKFSALTHVGELEHSACFQTPYPLPNLWVMPQFPGSGSSTHQLKGLKGCCCSVAQLCLTLCDPMECSTPGFLSFVTSPSLLKLMSIEWVMQSNHLIGLKGEVPYLAKFFIWYLS